MNGGCCIDRYEVARRAFDPELLKRGRDRPRKLVVEKLCQCQILRCNSPAHGRKRPVHAVGHLSSFRECNPPGLLVPRSKPPERAASFVEISEPPPCRFQVWRDRSFGQIPS